MTDTIFALASGTGRAAVAVIRLSGPASATVLRQLAGRLPPPRRASLAMLRDPGTGAVIDHGLALWLPGPHSFTGEDSAELQVHGSRAVIGALLEALGAIPGCRLAQPGEFTRRAFAHGKLDLAAVEGLADLIDAQTEAQRRQALRQLDGALGRWVAELRSLLVDALALTESGIDFADEADVATDATAGAIVIAADVAARIRVELDRRRTGERVREGFVVALAGPPNAGKSTLLNTLAQRDVALVSPVPGTTRDAIEVELDLGGFAVVLVDTAGLRDTDDAVEAAGMARTRARAESADLVLWLQEAATVPAIPTDLGTATLLRVGTKRDEARPALKGYDLVVSAHTGEGLPDLIAALQDHVGGSMAAGEGALVTRARHGSALETTLAALERAAQRGLEAELLAEDLRAAAAALGVIVGDIGTEEVLGAIFARFCIGK